ncbi:MAG TPA: serine/threonine-protein kinase [bacterium]|nr:serine/threonine-protein kinase [bacterium]
MTSDHFAALKRLLAGALELPAAERATFLERECAGNDVLRADAEAKLARLDADASLLVTGGLVAFVESAATSGLAAASTTASAPVRYDIGEKLGEGGFGEVYLAEQKEPVQRHVALKVLKPGLDTRAVLARFEGERQALARMEHPGIAKVLDAGSTDQGRPYFAMEYVDGLPITTHCDEHRLATAARLRLLQQACDAVQHAHQKAVIHRDIKPSNVLIGMQDGEPVVKVIDFGVAKAIETPLTEGSLVTEVGTLIGTPEYMSPEQADLSGDIDTRTDVYSLGATLYELLTGSRLFESSELREGGAENLKRVIRDTDPVRPSARVSTAAPDAASTVASRRRTTPRALAGHLRGDLDWITMKALAKDRSRRYVSPAELAADIERFLRHEPVIARPPGVAYRTARFVRRHRVGVAVAVVLALGFATFGVREQVQSRRVARERAAAERVAGFLADMMSETEPQVLGDALWTDLRGRVESARSDRRAGDEDAIATDLAAFDELTAGVNPTDAALRLLDEEILDRSARTVEERLAEDPLVAARLQATLGRTYRALGMVERAEPHARRALDTRRDHLPPRHGDVLTAQVELGALLVDREELEEAETLLRDALEARRSVLGDDHPETLAARHELSHLLGARGEPEGAEEEARIALAGFRRALGDGDARTLDAINTLGFLLQDRGAYDEAEDLWREALETRRRVLGQDDPRTLESMSNYGFLLQAVGRLDEAEPLYRAALDGMTRVLGDGHPWTLTLHSNLGFLLRQQGRLDEAEPYYAKALEGRRRVLGEDHTETLYAMNNSGFLLKATGRAREAEATFRSALDGFSRVLGEDHPTTLSSRTNLGYFLIGEGRPGDAEPLLREALAGFERALGTDHPDRFWAMHNLARALRDQDRLDEAERLYAATLEGRVRVIGGDHPHTNATRYHFACLRMQQGSSASALELLRQAMEAGYDVLRAESDPHFEAVHGTPEFEAILAEAEARSRPE